MICSPKESNVINVTERTSSMFTALITYDCSFMNVSDLKVDSNTSANCSTNQSLSNDNSSSEVNVTCHNIENKAGRNFEFTLSQNNSNQFINTTTFNVTLKPLPLNTWADITITVDTNLTSASISILNCEKIAEQEKFMFACDSSNKSSMSSLINCSHKCVNLLPGSSYEASLIRLPITIDDKKDDTFPEENITRKYTIDLDKITNLTFDGSLTENGIAVIRFNHPRGHYNELRFSCNVQDLNCFRFDQSLTNHTTNCSNCSFFSVPKVVRGVKYTCQASTIKAGFKDVASDELQFNTGE
ncbi:unnamed protein product [Rotaria sp. Silwood2]|nr:unnamed protein product [Rotaria sp. Silwood2]CAF4322659.1 unnamed protein product [Rotaria sp. Silwood2]